MLPIDLETPATVVLIPSKPGAGPASTAKRGVTLTSAVRYVVEQLPPGERPRAVVRTPTKSLFIEEIEALYEQPEFPKPLARAADSSSEVSRRGALSQRPSHTGEQR